MSSKTPYEKQRALDWARRAPLYPALPVSGWRGNPRPATYAGRLVAWLIQAIRCLM